MAANSNVIKQYEEASPGLHNAIKTLRTNIKFSTIDKEIKTLVITSTRQDEGKTTVAVYLGIAMAESGQKTVIVNADCYKPTLSGRLGRRSTRSWLDLLYGRITLEEAAMPTEHKGLYFMDIEPDLAAPVELIGSNRFAAMIETLKENFDIVLFDTPPLGAFIEAALLAAKADGTIIVLSVGEVDQKKALEVIEQLKKANARILGVVLNKVKLPEEDYYGFYHSRAAKGKKHNTAPLKEPGYAISSPKNSREYV
ncbi:MAG: CpsD/CapB family tyrosine-protein kinase [Christensenellales bacterium]